MWLAEPLWSGSRGAVGSQRSRYDGAQSALSGLPLVVGDWLVRGDATSRGAFVRRGQLSGG